MNKMHTCLLHCVKLNKGRLRCTEIIWKDELISDVSYQLKRKRNPWNQFLQEQRNHAKFTRKRFSVILCFFIDIFLAFKYSMQLLFNPKAYFHFLNINFSLSVFSELLKSTATFSTFFSLYDVWHFDNVSVLLNSVAATYVHLATSNVTKTCWYVFTAKLEIHTGTRLK